MKKFIIVEVALLVIGGFFLWNTWIFGWLNHGVAGYTRMSISELNVAGQPYAKFFSITEGLSGVLLLISGLGLVATIHRGLFMLSALGLVALIGGLTLFDAIHPVDCNRFHNPVCVLKVANGQVSNVDKEHGAESTITGYAAVLLALVLVMWAFVHRVTGEDVAIAEVVLVIILAIGVMLPQVVHGNGIVFKSVGQRAWNTVVSFEFLYVAYKVRKNQRRIPLNRA